MEIRVNNKKFGNPEGISYNIKKNVASDILAPSADATHLHIARVRILRSVLV